MYINSQPLFSLSIAEAKEFINETVSDAIRRELNISAKEPPKLYGMSEALEYFRVNGLRFTEKYLYILINQGKISRRKVGKRNVFTREDLDEYLEKSISKPEPKSEAAARLADSANRKRQEGRR